MKHLSAFLSFVFLCASISYASWQNPVFLSELNDYQNGYAASYPNVSDDEDFIFFIRSTPTKIDALWEARRNPETGVFDQQRQLSELKYGGAQVYGSWISQDKLRLYYCACDPQNLGWSVRPVWMAIRSNPNAPWQTIKRHIELEVEPFPNDCTLTADEKCIMYESASWAGGGIRRIFTATRPSILHNFSNVKELFELEALNAWRPHMSADGLKVYFRILNNEGVNEAWMGRRDSIEDAFGNFVAIEELNVAGISMELFQSWNGQQLYYKHRPDDVFDINNTGIYVSEWVDDSYADAINNLHQAAAKKQQAIELLAEAGADERTAVQILSDLPKEALPDGLTDKARWEAIRNIYQSLKKQEQVSGILQTCIANLQSALWLLPPPIQ
jgi:hypothetical protein